MAPQPRRQSACVRLRQEDLFAFASSAEKGPGFGAPRAGAAYAPKSAESSFDRTFAITACVTVGRQTLHSKAIRLGRDPGGRDTVWAMLRQTCVLDDLADLLWYRIAEETADRGGVARAAPPGDEHEVLGSPAQLTAQQQEARERRRRGQRAQRRLEALEREVQRKEKLAKTAAVPEVPSTRLVEAELALRRARQDLDAHMNEMSQMGTDHV